MERKTPLKVIRRNQYDDATYSQITNRKYNDEIVFLEDIPNAEIWSIMNYSRSLVPILNKYHPGWRNYESGRNYYAVSWNAPLDPNPRSVTVQIHFLYQGVHYHLLVSDDKFYAGSPAGSTEEGEILEAAAKREVFEETGIDLSDINLVKIGSYSVDIFNSIADYRARVINTVFVVFLPFWKVEHLFNFELDADKINFVEVKDGSLNETELIIVFNNDLIYDVPEEFVQFKRNRLGRQVSLDFSINFPQRQFLERFMDDKPLILPKKFINPRLNKRFERALDEWNEINLDYQF